MVEILRALLIVREAAATKNGVYLSSWKSQKKLEYIFEKLRKNVFHRYQNRQNTLSQ